MADHDGKDLSAKVEEWMEQSGQLLELRTARTLLQAGLPVLESYTYKDPITRTEREGDVLLDARTVRDARHNLMVAIECKHTASSVWIGVQTSRRWRKSPQAPEGWFAWVGHNQDDLFSEAVDFGVLNSTDEVCDRVVAANFKNPGDQRNTAYDATRQALSAAFSAKDGLDGHWDEETGSRYLEGAAVAAVVTTASLFVGRLDTQGELVVTPTTAMEVLTSCGPGQYADRPVMVMTPEALPEWAGRLRTLLRG